MDRDEVRKAFGAALREQRQARGLLSEELAKLAEVDRSYISTLEMGKRSPKIETMLEIAAALDVSLSVIIDRMYEILAANRTEDGR